MREIRLVDQSVHYYLENNLTSIWGTFLSVISGFPPSYEYIVLPTVAVGYIGGELDRRYELGTETTDDYLEIEVDIFGRNRAERDDLSDIVEDLLSSGCGVLQFSGGNAGVRLGNVVFRDIEVRPLFSIDDIPPTIVNSATVVAKAEISITGN